MKHDSGLRSARFLVAAALFLPGVCRAQQPRYNISTVAGNGTDGFVGDNAAANQAELSDPCGIAVDSAGNIYIVDSYNFRIRMVTPNGTISTIAGNGSIGAGRDGGAAAGAQLNFPQAVALGPLGVIYISDRGNNGPLLYQPRTGQRAGTPQRADGIPITCPEHGGRRER